MLSTRTANVVVMLCLIVTPHRNKQGRRHPNRFDAMLEGETEVLCTSSQPFLDGARKLLARGHSPQTILVMRHAGSDDVALRGSLGAAAKLTVDEHNGTVFAKWKPFCRSAGSARIANPAARRKGGRPREGDQQAPATQTNQASMKHARR
jgi:hypothetical protein